jgi:hypothetical protein
MIPFRRRSVLGPIPQAHASILVTAYLDHQYLDNQSHCHASRRPRQPTRQTPPTCSVAIAQSGDPAPRVPDPGRCSAGSQRAASSPWNGRKKNAKLPVWTERLEAWYARKTPRATSTADCNDVLVGVQ